MKEKFYITTAIAYTSQKPHIGNVYEAVLTDAVARYKRLSGKDVYFLTGTDEHGQKIEDCAKKAGITPKEYVDKVAGEIRKMWDLFNVSYDGFIRTTDEYHEETVKKIFRKLYEQGDIYKGVYEGHYCKPCESFWTDSQLVDGCCPDCGAPVVKASEEAYFFRMSKYQDRLLKYMEEHEEFVTPANRKSEMINNFLRPGLQDLCVSRSTFKWGVPIDFDPKHVIYVWIDALSNYITALGYDPFGESDEKFNKLWPADVHVIGKDIARFHTVYWPIILFALGLPLPKKVLCHNWLLFNKGKMSKSKGNVIYGDDLVNTFGLDTVRYYLLSEMSLRDDGNISYEAVAAENNTDLANILGNLVSRTAAMIKQNFDGIVPAPDKEEEIDAKLKESVESFAKDAVKNYEKYEISDACEDIISLFRACNKYIDETQPWVLAKSEDGKKRLATVLSNLVSAVRIGNVLFMPIAPESADKITKLFGFEYPEAPMDVTKAFTTSAVGNTVGESVVLFARVDMKKLEEKLKKEEEEREKAAKKAEKEKKKAEKKESDNPGIIDISDFAKVSLKVGQVVECDKVENSDKLLKLKVDIGTEVRQVVSGIAKFYKPEDVLNKKIVLVENLKPVKLRGVDSNGMILAAGEDEIKVIFVDDSIPNGSKIR